jgi:Ca2+-binding EF-hand superfamily protein
MYTEGNGYIRPINIETAIAMLGQKVSKKDLKEIILKHDHTGSVSISFDSFRKIFDEAQFLAHFSHFLLRSYPDGDL